METDVPSGTKTREHTEGAAGAVQAKHGNSCSENRVDPDPMCLTSFGDDSTGPPTLPCSKDNAMIRNGAAAPKSCLSSLEMRTPIAAGGLLPADTISTATRIPSDQPPIWFCPNQEEENEEINSIRLVLQNFLEDTQLASPFWPRVTETKSGQNLVFDPDGLTDHPAPARFWERGARCFVGWFSLGRWMRLQRFLVDE